MLFDLVYTMWPGDKKPNISPNFYTSFSMSYAQVEGTVLFTQPGSCTSSEVGRVFDTSSRESPGSDNNCQFKVKPIRGGTDGAQLSFKGLPCPNIFAGGHNFHGKYEFVPIQSMEKATEVVKNIIKIVANR